MTRDKAYPWNPQHLLLLQRSHLRETHVSMNSSADPLHCPDSIPLKTPPMGGSLQEQQVPSPLSRNYHRITPSNNVSLTFPIHIFLYCLKMIYIATSPEMCLFYNKMTQYLKTQTLNESSVFNAALFFFYFLSVFQHRQMHIQSCASAFSSVGWRYYPLGRVTRSCEKVTAY